MAFFLLNTLIYHINNVSLQKEIKRKMNNGKEFRSNNDGRRQFTCQPLDCQSTRRRQANSDRSRISVFTKQNTNKQNGTWERYSRTTEENESKRLISIAKENNLYIEYEETESFGSLYSKQTGESKVYANEKLGLVFKVYDPFAKRVIKELHPIDIIYEHIVHNILFPSTHYTFLGISSIHEDVRIILSQSFCEASLIPTDEEITAHLKALGLNKENNYYFGNEYLAITDISSESDNVLKDENGVLYFIDPIIKLKKSAPEVIDWLLSDNCYMWNNDIPHNSKRSTNIITHIKNWLKKLF